MSPLTPLCSEMYATNVVRVHEIFTNVFSKNTRGREICHMWSIVVHNPPLMRLLDCLE